jgi:hypothetical protein
MEFSRLFVNPVNFWKKNAKTYSYFHNAITQNPIKPHFLTDKGPNIVSQYDFWTITIFTSPGLALKMVIFQIFSVQSFEA